MSEPTAPLSTAEVATNVIASAEAAAADAADDAASVTDTPAAEVTSTEQADAAAPAPTPAEVDELAKELGLEAPRRPDGREQRIPYSRVKEMIEKKLQKATTEWESKVKEHTDKLSSYESERQAFAEVQRLIQHNPEAFLQSLAQVNPAYSRFIGGNAGAYKAPEDAPASMPQPDVDIGNGQRSYSVEGLNKLLAWQAQQTEARVVQRFAPIEQQWKSQAMQTQAAASVKAMIEDARQWPGFTEHEAEVLQALRADRKMSLDAAYRKVVLPKLQADRNKLREELLAEIKAKPTTTSVPTPAPATPTPKTRTTEDIAREIIAKGGR